MSRYFSILLVSLPLLAAFCLSTSDHYRIKTADHYAKAAEYGKALRLYQKVLRRDSIKHHLPHAASREIYFKAGDMCSKMDMPDAAIESYAKGAAASPGPDIGKYTGGEDPAKDKLSAVGLLEGGRYAEAAAEFQRLKKLYPDFRDRDRYIKTARVLEEQKPSPGTDDFYFSIGDGYIRQGLFEEAKGFYTKRILHYGMRPLRVLRHLKDAYSADAGVREKVWGRDIYVTLEDFESAEYGSKVLDMPRANTSGLCVFEKVIEVPLDNNRDLDAGIRLLVKCDDPSVRIMLGVEITYLKARASGISLHSTAEDAGNGWTMHKIESLSEAARGIARDPSRSWSMEDAFINKCVLVIWAGPDVRPGNFYLDEIQLYLDTGKTGRA